MQGKWRVIGAALALSVTLVACGGSEHDGGHDGASQEESDTGSSEFAFGEAAPESDAQREITVDALDKLAFDPGELDVEAGEVITFVVTNVGKAKHEFVLGDRAYQQEHEEMMEGGHGMDHTDNAVEVEPGQTARLTWRFSEPGEVLYGCHESGHYAGGMVGSITVS